MRLWDGFWWQDWTLNWVIWPGSDIHWAIAYGWVCRSGSLGGWGQRLHSSAGRSYGFGCMMVHGCKLISTAGQGYNSVSMISWGYRPCFLVSFISGSALYSYRDWTLRLVELLYTLWSGRLELIGLIPFQAKAYNRVCSLARILARDSRRANCQLCFLHYWNDWFNSQWIRDIGLVIHQQESGITTQICDLVVVSSTFLLCL